MKNYTMFNYDWLMSDHFSKLSDQAKWYYVKLNFFANNGFVPSPLSILDSLGYDRSILNELIANDDVLTLPDRSEVFITAYFVHNKGMNTKSWFNTPYGIYWTGKLYVKKNGIATFKPQKEEVEKLDHKIIVPSDEACEWDDRLPKGLYDDEK